jgi:hypothetical protein
MKFGAGGPPSSAAADLSHQFAKKVRYKTPKNGKARTIAISGHLVEELRARRLRQAEELLKVGIRLSEDTFVWRKPMAHRCSRTR